MRAILTCKIAFFKRTWQTIKLLPRCWPSAMKESKIRAFERGIAWPCTTRGCRVAHLKSPIIFLEFFFSDIRSDSTNSSQRTEIESKVSSASDISSSLETNKQNNGKIKQQNNEKPQTLPKPKMLLTQDGRLKPVPPPRPTKSLLHSIEWIFTAMNFGLHTITILRSKIPIFDRKLSLERS